MNRPGRILVLAVMAALPALAGCSTGTEAPAMNGVEAVVKEALTRDDPEHCETIYTQRFMEQVTGEEGTAALGDCREEEADDDAEANARSVALGEPAWDGSRVSVVVEVTGGSFDGATLELELVDSVGGWQLDRLAGLELGPENFDRAVTEAGLRSGLRRTEAKCVLDAVYERHSLDEIEDEIIAGGDALEDPELLAGCVSADSARQMLIKSVRETGEREGLGPAADCVVRALRRISDEQVVGFIGAGQEEVEAFFAPIWQACAEAGPLPDRV